MKRTIRAEAFNIITRVADEFRTTTAHLRSPGRVQSICDVRAVAVVLLRRRHRSYVDIGRMLKRHHTTIIALHLRALNRRDLMERADRIGEQIRREADAMKEGRAA